MAQDQGWISYVGGGNNSHLTEGQRLKAEAAILKRKESRGGLLGVVQVRVYEHACELQVGFPQGSLLGVETEGPVISDMVARAQTGLSDWR